MKGQLESQHGKTNRIIFSSFFFLGDALHLFKVDNVQIKHTHTHTQFSNLVIFFYFHC
jgi:hypothetical protein